MERAASFSFFFLLLLLLYATLPCWEPAAAASSGRWTTACNGTVGGGHRCRVEEDDAEEFPLDSESNRRLLISNSISNSALDPNKPVCYTKDGKPYNCGGYHGNAGSDRTCRQGYYRCSPPH
ncbi:hypothetical protein ZIOFF_001087 [Zingiber officinale]|uniref:Rapid ALkalinization Factor n=1 Tax=Zingiber officinale TaxID=94328 RepID=A0A8J5I5D3_ZINOF|nr:hypothetical protein ZIOFF_001087 [Zingiber officinale]